jgi:HEAT repeat protein
VVSQELLRRLKSQQEVERTMAAEALARLPAEPVVPLLLEALHTEQKWQVCQAMVRALGHLGDRRAVPHLLAFVDRQPWRTDGLWSAYVTRLLLEEVVLALVRLNDVLALMLALEHANPVVRLIAADALERVSRP